MPCHYGSASGKTKQGFIVMKGNIYFLIAIFAITASYCCFGDEKIDLFNKGNESYKNGKYKESLESYLKILDMGYESGELYFNIGNCYYKLNDIGRSILFYEKAKKLIPGNKDLNANLQLARLKAVDRIKPLPEFFLFKLIRTIIYLFPLSFMIWTAAGFYTAAFLFLIIWTLSRKRFIRLFSLRTSMVLGSIFLLFSVGIIGQTLTEKNKKEAVILVDKVDVKGSPSEDGIDVFSLHEGTKVRIDQESDEWIEIVLADGKVGWIKKTIVGII